MGCKVEKLYDKNKKFNSRTDDHGLTVFEPGELIKKQAYAIELDILSLSGLTINKDMFVQDVYINYYGRNYIHTLICKDTDNDNYHQKDSLLLLHGYQGNFLIFYRVLKYLFQFFNIYCLDHIGMGLSSRPQVDFIVTTELYVNFLIDAIEKWREELNIERFLLIGHSFGGYLASHYALKYPDHIKKLILLSPCGITDYSKGGNVLHNMNFQNRVLMSCMSCMRKREPTLQTTNDYIPKTWIKYFLKRNFNLDKFERKLLSYFYFVTLHYPKDINWIIYRLFRSPLPTAYIPLEDRLLSFKSKYTIDFYFGKEDWMDTIGPLRLHRLFPSRFKLDYVSNGHNFILENPREFFEIFATNLNIELNSKLSRDIR